MDSSAPRIDPTSLRGRKRIDATFRAIAKWRPAFEWGAVVVQLNRKLRRGYPKYLRDVFSSKSAFVYGVRRAAR